MFLVSSPLVVHGDEVVEGESGIVGNDGTDGMEGGTIPVESENILTPDPDTEEGVDGGDGVDATEEVTGGLVATSTADIIIETGDASAGALLSTDVNSNDIQSTISTTTPLADLDTYELSATGTNDAIVDNLGTTTAVTGENLAESYGNVFIETGDAISVLNIANIVNTTVINSLGYMQLLNKLIEGTLALDLQELFFPGGLSALEEMNQCTLMSCASEDVVYNLLNTNNATITNNANLDAISGTNAGYGDVVTISTGDTFGAANIINIANTNIIDSNYRLVAVNGLGTLNGDLVLPSEALFRMFFGLPNGLNQVENAGDAYLVDSNVNIAGVNNNLNTIADTGSNNATTSVAGHTDTGVAYAESNVVNEVNKNLFGGDSLMIHIRVHGSWNGTVYGLPEGLSWMETADGIVIFNEDAEVVPSDILNYDIDSYTAHFNNTNTVTIENNININSISGENELEAGIGVIQTGNAYAGANVLNVANTNVVGRNWVLAIMNIFGDFNGNVSFGRPDLWIGGQVQSLESEIGQGTKLTYTYTIKNNGNLKATEVNLSHIFDGASIRYDAEGETLTSYNRQEEIGVLQPGETRVVSFDAYVDEDLPYGTTTVSVDARLSMRESDSNRDDNKEILTVMAIHNEPITPPAVGGGGTGDSGGETGSGAGSTGGGGGSTSGGSSVSSGGGGGGGGGSKSSKGKVLGAKAESTQKKINPNKPPAIIIRKIADTNKEKVIRAGTEVDYTVTVKNAGGLAYNAKVFDRLLNPIGAVVSEQSWDLGTIGAGEIITLEYSVKYASDTPSGFYTNTASIVAYKKAKDTKNPLKIPNAVHTLEIKGKSLSIGNVETTTFLPMGNGQHAAIVSWETTKPTNGQVFFDFNATVSPYNKLEPNYGYGYKSYLAPILSTKHYIVLTGLINGGTYNYRIRSANAVHETMGGDYLFTVPGLTLSSI